MSETWVIKRAPTLTNLSVNINVAYSYFNIQKTASLFEIKLNMPLDIRQILCGSDPIFNFGWQGTETEVRTVTFETAPTGELLEWLQANAVKQEPPTPTLEPLRVGDKKIIGMYALNKFVIKQYIGEKLVYSKDTPIPKLSTPQNVSATGTVVEFDPVENAESYEVFADGVSIGEFTPQTGFNVTVNISEVNLTYKDAFRIYDGQNTSGTLLYESLGSTPTLTPQTLTITSGYLTIEIEGGTGDPATCSVTTTGNITPSTALIISSTGSGGDPGIQTFTVAEDGTITCNIDWDD